ncbi:hypothetical protein AURDEDRAFT_167782 [Auricularia subglabra TFB-10046 SS5]|nr:hypothetical protein AURDEDRAFT_167782 [Auricularia subglabra TFB-10046 SS5]
MPVTVLRQHPNTDGTVTIDLVIDMLSMQSSSVTTAFLKTLVEKHYERIRNLVYRSHKSSAKAINTVTQRYTNRAVKAVHKRESSFTETEPSDLEITIPPSPPKRARSPSSPGHRLKKHAKIEEPGGSGI